MNERLTEDRHREDINNVLKDEGSAFSERSETLGG